MIAFIDWWRIDTPLFPGDRCLADAADAASAEMSAAAVARLFVLETAAASLHAVQPTHEQISVAGSYVAALLNVNDPQAEALWECLGAVRCNDTQMLAAALNKAARQGAAMAAARSARAFAELAYSAALACGSWEEAYYAASILTRLAELDECPDAAERWDCRAHVHEGRMRRSRTRPD